MFTLSSHPRALRYYSPPVYSAYPDNDLYSPYHLSSANSRAINPEVRYRRALGEYVAAEEEYSAVLRARERTKLMRVRTERLRVAQLARARREQQAWQIKQGLANALVRAAFSGDDDLSLHDFVPVMYQHFQRPLSNMPITSCMDGRGSCADGAGAQMEKRDVEEKTSVDQRAAPASEPGECEGSVPNLESVLRERLQKIAGDEEVQDLARAILRHLTSATGVSPPAAASSPELNAYATKPDEGAHLSRSHVLQGGTAEAAKASFKAHRADVAERSESSPTSPTSRTAPSSLEIIENTRSALTKLSAGFSLPSSLEFSDDEPDGLAYTPTNAPVRAYEHALNKLLEELDAVESDGDEEVRVLRRAAVQQVEKTIEDVEKRVKEARESARQGGSPESAVLAEADDTEGKNVDGGVDGDTSLNDGKSKAEEVSSRSGDGVDSTPSEQPIPNREVGGPNVARPIGPKSKEDDGPSILIGHFAEPRFGGDIRLVDASEANDEEWILRMGVFAEGSYEVTTEQITPAPSVPEISGTPLDPPVEVSLPIRGAIAPSPTPVGPLAPHIIPDSFQALLCRDPLPSSVGEDEAETDDVDDEAEWSKI